MRIHAIGDTASRDERGLGSKRFMSKIASSWTRGIGCRRERQIRDMMSEARDLPDLRHVNGRNAELLVALANCGLQRGGPHGNGGLVRSENERCCDRNERSGGTCARLHVCGSLSTQVVLL
jgi:hypothetical protein